MQRLVMEINDYKSINKARIEINRINIIGGVNGSGKSTASRIFYSFLKGNSTKRRDFAMQKVVSDVNQIIDNLNSSESGLSLPAHLNIEDGDSQIYDKCKSILELSKIAQKRSKIKGKTNDIVNKVENRLDLKINDILSEISIDDSLIDSLFVNDTPLLSSVVTGEILKRELAEDCEVNVEFYMCDGNEKSDAYEYFFNNVFVNSVFYIDSLSIFDLLDSKKLFHLTEILDELLIKENDGDGGILEKLDGLLKSSYTDNFPNFKSDGELKEKLKSHLDEISAANTPSGIKQLGIVEVLLLNNKLKKGGYLIIDEPEVNLHPEWQFKFAEILVLLSKHLDITLYINSHSPFFIESVDAFTEFYDMTEDISYYLTEPSQVEGKFNFTKIRSDELYKLYENLGNPYQMINQLRLRKRLGK